MTEQRKFTRAEVANRNNKEDAVFIIHNVVYDVTPFLDEHPGGHEVLLQAAGTDASEEFQDIGHSLDAKELMRKFQVGEIVEHEHVEVAKREYSWDDVKGGGEASALGVWKLPLLAALLGTLAWFYFS